MLQRLKGFVFPFYPLLIGVYAVLQLWSANTGQVLWASVQRAFLTAFLVSLGVTLLAWLVTRNWQRGALLAALTLMILFFYGHFFTFLDQRSLFGFVFGRHRYLAPLSALIVLAVMVWALRSRRDLKTLSGALNWVVLVMMLVAAVPLIYYQVRYQRTLYAREAAETSLSVDASLPDVYYIILDGYTSSDVLLDEYGYDNSAFIQQLEKLGFKIPACAYSNYFKTTGSMSATLNMAYLNELGISDADASSSFSPSLAEFIIKSKVRAEFEAIGYKSVAFRGFMPSQDVKNADYYFNLQEEKNEKDYIGTHSFERMWMRTTILRPVIQQYESNPYSLQSLPAWALAAIDLETAEANDNLTNTSKAVRYYEQSLYQFDMMHKIPDLPGKKFVYSHFYSTHQPYVLDKKGNLRLLDVSNEAYYVPALQYTEGRIIEIVETILRKSDVPPIIIIQGDHGKQSGLIQSKILNAYYLPGAPSAKVYDTITPVNTFRLILSQYFGKDYPLLDDVVLTKDGETFKHLPVTCDLH